MKPLIAIDCYCGAGGLSLGLQRSGFDVAWAFDSSATAVSTYNRNISNHAVCLSSDVISERGILEVSGIEPGQCDLVAGGPPCQGFSRQRRGSDFDPRNDEIMRFFSFVSALLPKFFLLENVPALQGPRGMPYLKMLYEEAARQKYVLRATVLNSAEYRVPQMRKRLFIVGERTTSLNRFEFPSPLLNPTEFLTVIQAIGDLPKPSSAIANHEPDMVSELNRIRISHVPQGGGREHIPKHLQLKCHRVSVEKAGHRNVYGRLHANKPANTITTKCNSFTRGMFAHPLSDRNITMREAARLQGFPDDFVFLGNRVDVAHQIGNAVPPPLAMALGGALRAAMR